MRHKLHYRGVLGIVKVLCQSGYAKPEDQYSHWWKDVDCTGCIFKRVNRKP